MSMTKETERYRDIILTTMRVAVSNLSPIEFMTLLKYFTNYFAEVLE